MARVEQKGFTAGLLDRVERWGNKLPHPFNLFILFSLLILVFSWIAHAMGLAVTHPVTGKPIAAVNLLDRQGIQNIITKAVANFTGFAPLGTVLVAMIGVGVRSEEHTSELQSLAYLVCRLLLEKKKK